MRVTETHKFVGGKRVTLITVEIDSYPIRVEKVKTSDEEGPESYTFVFYCDVENTLKTVLERYGNAKLVEVETDSERCVLRVTFAIEPS